MNNNCITLVVCDGLGLSPERNGNAFTNAATPTFDNILQNYPAVSLQASGSEVGLDDGEPGNSEVGHLTIGTGQVLPQAFQIVNRANSSGEYTNNKAFLLLCAQAIKNQSTLHIIGLISRGGVHGYLDHMVTYLTFANNKGVRKVVVHAITDGRDGPERVARTDIQEIEHCLTRFESGVIGSVSGRYFAMDRDHNWDRTDQAYWAMMGKGQQRSQSVRDVIGSAYARGETDETLSPTVVVNDDGVPVGAIQTGDVILFTNYRPDRIRQLATRLISTSIILTIVTLTDYFFGNQPQFGRPESLLMSAYPLPKPEGTLSEILASQLKSQLHIAETEKYAHVTYFFDGHQEVKHTGEQWLMIPSLKINSFERAPEMSASQITQAYLDAITNSVPDFTIINYANADMVGHTGNYQATVKAIECIDTQLRILVAHAESRQTWLLITSDHGNAEQKIEPTTGEVNKEHTTNPVPFLLVHPSLKKPRGLNKMALGEQSPVGMLADIAPTILAIMEIAQSKQMVGSSLLEQLLI